MNLLTHHKGGLTPWTYERFSDRLDDQPVPVEPPAAEHDWPSANRQPPTDRRTNRLPPNIIDWPPAAEHDLPPAAEPGVQPRT